MIAQLAVFAAARRAGRTRPAEALRDATLERPRPGILQIVCRRRVPRRRRRDGADLQGHVGGLVRDPRRDAARGRRRPARPCAARAPRRAGSPARCVRFGASGLLASTSLATNRWRTAALATPIVLVAMLAGTQGVVQSSGQHDTEAVTAARVTAPFVIVGRDGAPLPADTAKRIHAAGVTTVATTEIYPDDAALRRERAVAGGGRAPPAARPRSTSRCSRATRPRAPRSAACSPRRATSSSATRSPRRWPTRRRRTFTVAAIYERAAGLGDVLVDDAPAPAPRGLRQRHPPAPTRHRRPGPHPRRVHTDAAHARQRVGLGRLADRRPRGPVHRPGPDQHRGDGHRRTPRRARHHPPARRHRRPRDPHRRPRDPADRPRRPRRRRSRSSRSPSTASRAA